MSKCDFGMIELYLGKNISAEGVRVDLENVSQLKGFLGLCGFYRRFVRVFSQTIVPLTNLTWKDAFEWSDKVQQYFDKFKELMSTCLVLAIPDFNRPFELHCDALSEGLGAVLMQERHPIAFESRKLRGVEMGYNIYDKEMLPICMP
ncbi:uncharacterized mitochondrial protein AtMg00860-like [Cryptomeria japonica]|uniref:uncharacterized mitochondrial protein AtMg00860-like n=1 Tax=Cryptomeria japonica TaxID=3369 RepID=UPI0027DA1033|nr:uncharacterized mitochondrial protein AtMg00860-like [Cryptomeria japonica]